MTGKIREPFGLITQREWDGLIARGADAAHIAMYVLVRVRADRDGVSRDSVRAYATRMNRSHDTVERLLRWLRDHGVISQRRTRSLSGPRGLTWLYERRALSIDEWTTEYASVPPPSDDGLRTDAPSTPAMDYANEGDGVRNYDLRSTHPLGDNPDVPPERVPDRLTSPSEDVLEGDTGRLAKDVLSILMASRHHDAFDGKVNDIVAVLSRHPGKDPIQTAEAIAERMEDGIVNGPEFFETWLVKAPRVRPREREYTADEIRARLQIVRLAPSIDDQLAALKRRSRTGY
jgi:hypothetical protein